MALDLIAELDAIVAALDRAGVEYALCGGLALGVLGRPRMTMDIDLIIRPEQMTDALRIARDISKLDPDPKNLVPLDLKLVCPDCETAWTSRSPFTLAGNRRLVCVSREGLTTMKRLAGRPQDIADIAKLEGRADDDVTDERETDMSPAAIQQRLEQVRALYKLAVYLRSATLVGPVVASTARER